MDVVTGPGIRAFWQGAFDAGVVGESLETVSFEELGDVAVEEGRYEMRISTGAVDHGKYVVVHRRRADGSWRFGTDIRNPSLPEAAPH